MYMHKYTHTYTHKHTHTHTRTHTAPQIVAMELSAASSGILPKSPSAFDVRFKCLSSGSGLFGLFNRSLLEVSFHVYVYIGLPKSPSAFDVRFKCLSSGSGLTECTGLFYWSLFTYRGLFCHPARLTCNSSVCLRAQLLRSVYVSFTGLFSHVGVLFVTKRLCCAIQVSVFGLRFDRVYRSLLQVSFHI